MLYKLPRFIPPWSSIVADLGNPSPAHLAKTLDVTERTVRRWTATDHAPTAARLALFWFTRWGYSTLDAELFNTAQMHAGMVASLRDDVARLQADIARLQALGAYGCANDPLQAPGAPRPAFNARR